MPGATMQTAKGGVTGEPVRWSDYLDDVIRGDLTAAAAYITPAKGAVVTAVAPCGMGGGTWAAGAEKRHRPAY